MLHEFLRTERSEIIARTQVNIRARSAPKASEIEIDLGIPLFFDQLIEMLKQAERTPRKSDSVPRPADSTSDAITATATKYGHDMLRRGFTVAQVVYDYGNICQALTEHAFERGAPITVDEFHTLNRCLDDAIAQAVTEYGRLREQAVIDKGTERIGVLAHEMRNKLSTAMLSFGMLKSGEVSIRGSTGALLERSLKGLNDLIDRSLAEIRLESTVQRRETMKVAEFIEEMEVTAILEARERSLQLTVDPVDFDIAIDVDRQLLAAAVANLLQNAFKFSRALGSVRLRAHANDQRVFIDVQDSCGGLPAGRVEALFGPYNQRSANRSGVGLGLTISRRAVQLNGGEIRVHDLPGEGCVFTVDLPRAASANATR